MEVCDLVREMNAPVKLVSKEGEVFQLAKKAAFMSLTVNKILSDADSEDMRVPLPDVDSATLSKVVEYCNFCKNTIDGQRDKEWEKRFIDLFDDQALSKLTFAADYMEIKQLLDLASGKVASHFWGKRLEHIHPERFNVRIEYTLEEEDDKRFAWCDDE